MTREELSEAILNNGSLRGMVFGYVAEIKLRKLLASHADVTSHVKDDDHDRSKKGDLRVVYKGHEFRSSAHSFTTGRTTKLHTKSANSNRSSLASGTVAPSATAKPLTRVGFIVLPGVRKNLTP